MSWICHTGVSMNSMLRKVWIWKPLEQRLTVPVEVKEQGAEFITDYLIKLSGKTSRLNEMRIIFMGIG